MKKYVFLAILLGLLFAGCQKAPENIQANAPEAPATAQEGSAATAETAPQPAENRVVEKKAIKSANNAIAFEDVGIQKEWIEPPFPTKRVSQNGHFAFIKPGASRYFLVSEDDTLPEDQFDEYRKSIFKRIQSLSDNGEVYAYDSQTEQIGEKLDEMPNLPKSEMLQIVYNYLGNKVAVYVRYKQYDSGKFAETRDPVYAIYFGVSVIEGVQDAE